MYYSQLLSLGVCSVESEKNVLQNSEAWPLSLHVVAQTFANDVHAPTF